MSEHEPQIGRVNLLVGVCGAVSSLAVPHMLMWLRARLEITNVRVVLTAMAQRFITKESLLAVCAGEVATGWDDLPDGARNHVGMASWADVAVVLPATASFLGKAANGIGDDLLSSVVLAADCPVILVPATNKATWDKPAVRRNVERLRADGITVIEPSVGISVADGRIETGSLGDFRRPLVTAIVQAVSANRPNREERP